MSKIRRGYKVFRVSARADRVPEGGFMSISYLAPVYYRRNAWSYGSSGPLFVFTDYESARSFARYRGDVVIKEVYYIRITPKHRQIVGSFNTAAYVSRFWAGEILLSGAVVGQPPVGTDFAAAVTLDLDPAVAPDDDMLDHIFSRYSYEPRGD